MAERIRNYSAVAIGKDDFEIDWDYLPWMGWQPMNDGVLIERLEPIEQERGSGIVLTDMKQDGKMILRKGKVLAVGPGKWHPGEWWYLPDPTYSKYPNLNVHCWEWISGWRETPEVKPGDIVLFNARWNDLAHAENRGSGADGKGPMERPLSYRFDPKIHLVQENDIAGVLHGNFSNRSTSDDEIGRRHLHCECSSALLLESLSGRRCIGD